MSRAEEIRNNISYIYGPNGETVVLVPVKQAETEEESATGSCKNCATVLVVFGIIALVCGVIFLSVYLAAGGYDVPALDFFWDAIVIVFVIGAFLILISIPMFFHLKSYRKDRIHRYMHKDKPEDRQPVLRREEVFTDMEEVDPEAFSTSYENYYPVQPNVPVHGMNMYNRERNHILGHDGIPMRSVERGCPSRDISQYPVERSHLHYHSHSPVPNDSLRVHPGRHSANSYSPLYYPSNSAERLYPGRGSPIRSFTDIGPPYHSSPVGERSFSPSSDTTYLSQSSSGARWMINV